MGFNKHIIRTAVLLFVVFATYKSLSYLERRGIELDPNSIAAGQFKPLPSVNLSMVGSATANVVVTEELPNTVKLVTADIIKSEPVSPNEVKVMSTRALTITKKPVSANTVVNVKMEQVSQAERVKLVKSNSDYAKVKTLEQREHFVKAEIQPNENAD